MRSTGQFVPKTTRSTPKASMLAQHIGADRLNGPARVAHAEPRDLHRDVRRLGHFIHGRPPFSEGGFIALHRNGAMIDADGRVGEGASEIEQIAGKLDASVDARHELSRGKLGEAAAPGGIDKIAALAEIANSANVRVSQMPVEDLRRVRPRQMALRNDAVRIAGLVRERLQPFRLGHRIGRVYGGLNVDGLRHIGEADLGYVVLDAIALRFQWIGVRQKAMHGVRLKPAVAELRMLHVMQMEMRVDEGDFSHRPWPSVLLGPLPRQREALGNGLPASPAAFGHRNSQRHARSCPSEPRMPGNCNIVSIHNSGYGSFQVSLADRDGPLGASHLRLRREVFPRGADFMESFRPSPRNAFIRERLRRRRRAWQNIRIPGSPTVPRELLDPAGCWFAVPPAAASAGTGRLQIPAHSARSHKQGARPHRNIFRFSADKTACASR